MKKCILSLCFVALLCACEGPINTVGVKHLQLSPAQKQMVVTSNDFTYNLFNQVATANEDKCFISPLSASFALSMLANGADTETLDEILSVLGFVDYSLDDLNDYHKSLLEALPNLDNKTKMAIANAIFIQENYPIYDEFKQVNKDYYFARVENLDFYSNSAVNHINQWAANNTNNKIKKIVDQSLLADVRVMLANALYFKGKWENVFKKENTQKEEFTNADGSKSTVDMMNNTDEDYRYGENDLCRVLEMPYKGDAYVMDVVLPKPGKSLEEVRNYMSEGEWLNRYEGIRLNTGEVIVKMPKFTMEYERELKKDLQALGMQSAFVEEIADFSKLSEIPLFVDFVKQNTFLAIDEEGTEAAAITIIGTKDMAVPIYGPIEFFVDQPFIFQIREVQEGTVLFVGQINKL